MTAIFRPPPFGAILLLAPIVVLGTHYGYEAYLADTCLDGGGSFDYLEYSCSLSERFLLGTCHGVTRPHRLREYIDEFAYRFNRRFRAEHIPGGLESRLELGLFN